jgi:hypothetical protein
VTTVLLLDSKELCFPRQNALKAAICQSITVTNAQPKPLKWTKTTDDILASVARFCKRTSEQDTRLPCILNNACTSTSDAAEHDTSRNQCRRG